MNTESTEILRLSTGSAGLDQELLGLPRNEFTLVSGAEDTGKSTFCLQFLLAGLNEGERAVLVTSEPVEKILDLADLAKLPIREKVESNQLIILYQKTQVPGVLLNAEDLKRMVDALEAEILPWEPTRLAIDSALPLIGLFHQDYRRIGLLKLLRGFGAMGLTTVLTTRMPATSEAMSLKKALEDNAGCSFHFDEQRRTTGETQRRLVCRKMIGIEPPYPVFDFSIKPTVGLQVGESTGIPLDDPAVEVKSNQPVPKRSKPTPVASAATRRNEREATQTNKFLFAKQAAIKFLFAKQAAIKKPEGEQIKTAEPRKTTAEPRKTTAEPRKNNKVSFASPAKRAPTEED